MEKTYEWYQINGKLRKYQQQDWGDGYSVAEKQLAAKYRQTIQVVIIYSMVAGFLLGYITKILTLD